MHEATNAASEPVFISRSGAHVERFFLRSYQTSNLRLIDTFFEIIGLVGHRHHKCVYLDRLSDLKIDCATAFPLFCYV